MTQQLLVQADYTAFPVWLDRVGNPNEIELSEPLREALQAWSDEWTKALWGEFGPDDPRTPPPPMEWYREWCGRGKMLVERVQREVGDDYEVVFGHEEDRIAYRTG